MGFCDMEKRRLLEKLKQYSGQLTRQQVKTIRGQILAGDYVGAEKGLDKLTGKR